MPQPGSGFRNSVDAPAHALVAEFQRIGRSHRRALGRRAARIVLGNSVLRVFLPGTNVPLRMTLERIDADELGKLRDAGEFDGWYRRHLERLARVIQKTNARNRRVQPGYKWGHAAKVLSLYVCEVVLKSRYFADGVVCRLEPWIYVPIDRIAIGHLRRLGVRGVGTGIKDIDSPDKFYAIQDVLGAAADRASVPRAWFDDLWLER